MFGERIATLNERITKRDETIAALEKQLANAGDDDDGNSAKRHYLIGQLTGRYLDTHRDSASPACKWALKILLPFG